MSDNAIAVIISFEDEDDICYLANPEGVFHWSNVEDKEVKGITVGPYRKMDDEEIVDEE